MSEWQDISTAPKDGTVIDLWVAFPYEGYRWADASWLEAGKHNCHGPANWCSHERFPLHAFADKPAATHWMPLPDPPTAPERIAPRDTSGLTTE